MRRGPLKLESFARGRGQGEEMGGLAAGAAAMMVCLFFVAGGLVIGYILGRDHERREWLHWLKSLKGQSCADQCRRRFAEKNGV